MAAGNTYVALQTQTTSSTTSSVTFTSIPQGYTDLVLVTNGTSTSGGSQSISVQVGNGSVDTGANYSVTFLYGTGSSAASGAYSNTNYGYAGRIDSTQAIGITHFMNYSSTSSYKSIISRGNSAAAITIALANLWRSTAAINTIKLAIDGGYSFATGTTFTLYGIAAA